MTDNPSAELRAAAEKLRELAASASPGPWAQTGIGDYGWTVSSPSGALVETEDSEQGRIDAAYIAAMHPGVGAALADWLEWQARALNEGRIAAPDAALAVARQILGGQP